jgi:hypothetical protein
MLQRGWYNAETRAGGRCGRAQSRRCVLFVLLTVLYFVTSSACSVRVSNRQTSDASVAGDPVLSRSTDQLLPPPCLLCPNMFATWGGYN